MMYNILKNKKLEKQILDLFNESGIKEYINEKYYDNELFKKGMLKYYFLDFCDYVIKNSKNINNNTIEDNNDYFMNKLIEFSNSEQKFNKFCPNINNIIDCLYENIYINIVSNKIKRDFIKLFFEEIIYRNILAYIIDLSSGTEETMNTTMALLSQWSKYINKEGHLSSLININDFIIFYYFNKQFFTQLKQKYHYENRN